MTRTAVPAAATSGPRVAVVSARAIVRTGLETILTQAAEGHRSLVLTDDLAEADVLLVDPVDGAGGVVDLERLSPVPPPGTHLVVARAVRAENGARHTDAVTAVPLDIGRAELLSTLAAVARRPVAPSAPASRPPRGSVLSTRELQVLGLVSRGLSNTEIGQELYVSINTVKTYIRTAYRKIGVHSRSQAVAWARDHGLR
jgi:DNA-binding NarL/FixJ family response regulator